MSLRLFDRIATLMRADAHGVVEALEEKSLLLKQSLREAELELLDKRARLAALGEEEARVQGRMERQRVEIARLDEDVALALAGDREEIARFAIRRLLPLRRALAAAERERTVLSQARAALAEQLAAQEAAFEELRTRVRARLSRPRSMQDACDAPFASGPVDEAEVEIELLRRRGAHGEEAPR